MSAVGYRWHWIQRPDMEKPTEGHCHDGALQKTEDGILHGKQHTTLMLVLYVLSFEGC